MLSPLSTWLTEVPAGMKGCCALYRENHPAARPRTTLPSSPLWGSSAAENLVKFGTTRLMQLEVSWRRPGGPRGAPVRTPHDPRRHSLGAALRGALSPVPSSSWNYHPSLPMIGLGSPFVVCFLCLDGDSVDDKGRWKTGLCSPWCENILQKIQTENKVQNLFVDRKKLQDKYW